MKIKPLFGFIIVLALAIAPFPVQRGDASNSIGWLSYDAAKKKNESDAQKYFIFFSSQNCGYCRLLETKTFSNPDVSAYINENYIPVRVDVDKQRELAVRYRIQGVPDLRFLSKDGAVIGRWIGFTEPDHLLKLLKYIGTDSYLTMSFNDFNKK